MAQLPDDSTGWISNALIAIGTVATAVAGAYGVVKKAKSETTKEAATAARTTTESTLSAMNSVIDGLVRELDRREGELQELREDLKETHNELVKLEREKRVLEGKSDRQGRQIIALEERLEAQSKTITELQIQIQPRDDR